MRLHFCCGEPGHGGAPDSVRTVEWNGRVIAHGHQPFPHDEWIARYAPAEVGSPEREGSFGVRRTRSALPAELRAELAAVEPSRDGPLEYKPCRVTLDNGDVRDRVYVQEAEIWFDVWGVDPEEDSGKSIVPIEAIVAIESSPSRLPVAIANQLYDAGESSMGGCLFHLVLRDGTRLKCSTGNAVDFVSWPAGVGPEDVVAVVPHERSPADIEVESADFAWALYEETDRG